MILSTGTGIEWAPNIAASAQDLIIQGKNITLSTIPKGTPVFFTGSGTSGNLVGVIPADAGNPNLMPAGGILAEAIAAGDEGGVYIYGYINGVNTSAFAAGDDVFVAVGGGYTNIKPTGSALIQKLGNVEKVDNTNGSGVIQGPSWYNDLPNVQSGYTWVGNSNSVPQAVSTASLFVTSGSYAISASFASTASYVATASYTPTLQQVTTQGNITNTSVIFTGSSANSLQIVNSGGDIPFISVSGSVDGPTPGRLVDVVYNAISVNTNSTTTITQLPAPKVAGFTFDYVAYVSGTVLQAGRAGVVKGILRNTETGVVTKAFQINETTTLDLEDDGFGTAGLQFTIIQDTNGTSNQLVAITNNNWPYTINYTLTIYYNPDFS